MSLLLVMLARSSIALKKRKKGKKMRRHFSENREKVTGTDKGKPNINTREYLAMICSSGRLLGGRRQLEHLKEKTLALAAFSFGLLPDI